VSNAIATEAEYPYTGTDGTCAPPNTANTTVATWEYVTPSNMDALVTQLNTGPVSVLIDASSVAFGNYHSGVIGPNCNCGTSINHAVLAVGYGTENGVDYYLVKNSWGAGWGDAGYVKIARDTGMGVCGI
jgi:cathepsin L